MFWWFGKYFSLKENGSLSLQISIEILELLILKGEADGSKRVD
jgi:hypothetical protein